MWDINGENNQMWDFEYVDCQQSGFSGVGGYRASACTRVPADTQVPASTTENRVTATARAHRHGCFQAVSHQHIRVDIWDDNRTRADSHSQANSSNPSGSSTLASSSTPACSSTPVSSSIPAGSSNPVSSSTPAGSSTPVSSSTPAGSSTPVGRCIPSVNSIRWQVFSQGKELDV